MEKIPVDIVIHFGFGYFLEKILEDIVKNLYYCDCDYDEYFYNLIIRLCVQPVKHSLIDLNEKGESHIDYREVVLKPKSNDVQAFPPKKRVY